MRFFLANKRSLEQGLQTTPIRLSVTFMQALFDIELQYDSGLTYRVGGEKTREYHLHHLTQSDLQLGIILQKCCNTAGRFHDLTALSNVYDKITEYFEEPVCLSQFYASFAKFRTLGLLRVEHDEGINTYSMELNHYRNEETDRIGNHMKAHPFIFSKAFTSLSLREQKLFLSLYIQQGVNPDKVEATFRCFVPTKSEHVQYQDLQRFLHTNTSYVRSAISRLAEEKLFDKAPLFSKAFYRKEGKTFSKVFILVNPALHEHPLDEDCHDPIQPQTAYKRKANLLQRELESVGLGDLVAYKQGAEFNKMVRVLRNAGVGVVKYVVKSIYERFVLKEAYPHQVVPLVYDAVRDRTKARLLALADQHGLYRLISPGWDESEKEKRHNEFANALSHLSEEKAKFLFERLAPKIRERFMVPPSSKPHRYQYDERLTWLNGIEAIRKQAKRSYKDPEDYFKLEQEYGHRYTSLRGNHRLESLSYQREVRSLVDDFLEDIDKLPTLILVPAVDENFRLENELFALAAQSA
ncbi:MULTISPECIES: hypothetical protein [unclassified Paenibacillus]|uniref:hypothetical protein n=1 Tax=unclassified Paenibacillus TaxID=185978 RepID=UPI00277F1BDE|nr:MULTISPECIES: hypothetical protein [unclassified Paenibacillus]MDQ0896242.1 hypothetical protein [Paenibacillus sp. V4I7]MDQ0913830.1 hypothetical protein [Paenibacillus sp. V4I5]